MPVQPDWDLHTRLITELSSGTDNFYFDASVAEYTVYSAIRIFQIKWSLIFQEKLPKFSEIFDKVHNSNR